MDEIADDELTTTVYQTRVEVSGKHLLVFAKSRESLPVEYVKLSMWFSPPALALG